MVGGSCSSVTVGWGFTRTKNRCPGRELFHVIPVAESASACNPGANLLASGNGRFCTRRQRWVLFISVTTDVSENEPTIRFKTRYGEGKTPRSLDNTN